ncbi:MAG: HAD-IIB family hydrolase [Atopobiaceae bacterium]|nr:HAD-IIB family hydrolase [Atopobiaceae bacterium]
MIKLVLSDMDGTLLPKGGAHVSYRTVTAIRELVEAGVRFAPATGRQAYELDERFFGVRECYQTAITANGKRVYVDGELRYEVLMDRDVLLRVEKALSEVPNAFLIVEPAVNDKGKRPWPCIGARKGDAEWFGKTVGFPAEVADSLPDEEFISAEVACAGSDEQYEELIDQLRALAPECDFVTSQTHWCDILPKGSNKGTALMALLEELGIGVDEAVFFGDMENDLALMELVPDSVAVANATPAAAEAARWHVGDVADEGATVAIEQITEAAKTGGTPAFMLQESWTPAEAEAEPEVDEAYEDEGPLSSEAIRALLAAKLGPEFGGEAGTVRGAGADAL